MLGSVDRSYVFALIEALAQSEGRKVVETVESLRVQGLNAASALEEMASVLHRMAVYQSMGEAAAADSGDPQEADIARLAVLLPADETQLLYSICLHGRGDLGLAPDEYAALTMVLLRLLAFKPGDGALHTHSASGTLAAEKKSLKSVPEAPYSPGLAPVQMLKPAVPLSPATSAQIVQPDRPVSAQVATNDLVPPGQLLAVHDPAARHGLDAEPSDKSTPIHRVVGVPMRVQQESRLDQHVTGAVAGFVETEHGAFWQQTVQALVQAQAVSALARELALQSQLIGRDEDQWILRVESESLNQAGSRDRLGQALQAAGFAVNLLVEVGRVSDSPARRNARASAERQQAAEHIIHNNPLVKSWLRDFGAKIVPGSIRPL
jgi:DNA polymerase-3 subunit gamma/tau